jgi:two-component system phosphate regulon sensor histidine kinase PhoR
MAIDSKAIEAFLDVLDEPALVLRRDTVLYANAAAKALFGEMIDRQDIRLAIRNPKALSHILPGEPGDIEVSGIGGFGRPWTLSIRSLGDHRILVRLIDKSAAAAAEKMRVDFVANASHELRTPLAAVLGYAETLADDDDVDRDSRMRFGQTIRTEARRMLRIIEDLMGLSRIEADRFVAPTEAISIVDLVRSAAEQSQPAAKAAGSEILLEIEAGVPPVLGDRAQLTQLLDNLLSNAVRYGIDQAGDPVTVTIGSSDGAVRIVITDKGQGIPREHLPRLTERFYRVDSARSRDSGGTGLGLAIVKHIVERHRGTLDIRSEFGSGTKVTVTLPAARAGS